MPDFDLGPAMYMLRFLTYSWSFIEHLVHTGEQGLGVRVKWENWTDGKTVAKRGWNYAGSAFGGLRALGEGLMLGALPAFRSHPNLGPGIPIWVVLHIVL